MTEQTPCFLHGPGLAIFLGLWYKKPIHFIGTDSPDCLFYSQWSLFQWPFFDQIYSLIELPCGGSDGKAYNVGDLGSIPGSGRSPGGGNGNPLQYACLENPMMEEPGSLQSIVLQSQTRLNNFTFFSFIDLIAVYWMLSYMLRLL